MRPENFDLSSPAFLPVTDETCARLLETDGATALTSLSDPELAAVLVIQNLATAAEKDLTSDAIEKVLARLIAWSVDGLHSADVGLLTEAKRLFDPRKLYFGLKVIKSLKLGFLLADEVAAQDYLLPSGKWDFGYKVRHRLRNNPFSEQMVTSRHERWLSPAQDKLVRLFRANLDEHLHIQGYAGIGKSHLLGALMEFLRPGATLLLARTPGKLATLRERIGGDRDKGPGLTFEAFARKLLHASGAQRGTAAVNLPHGANRQAVAQELNILGFRGHDAQATLNICLEVLESYCRSWDYSLSAKHLPHFKQELSNVDAKVLLEYSSRLWTYLDHNPAWSRQTGFETLLLIKRASLAGCVVPARYTHVLIDESQDIPESLQQILERGRQVLVTLGDEYQQASGSPVKRHQEVRQRDVSYSVRSGRNVERLVNPLICVHSKKGKIPFEGARDAGVSIEHYPQGFIPPENCVVLTASHWDTMKWAIQLHDANCGFRFSNSEARQDFQRFMSTAIALFKPNYYSSGQGANDAHRDFNEISDWQQVRDTNRFDESFRWVEAELEKGFNVADMTRLSMSIGQSAKGCMLMLAQDAGGMEFDRVLLTPELLTTEKFENVYEFDQRVCAVYIAISRAKMQLYLPFDVVEWVEFHDGQKYREVLGY
ncbi:hypothetical protein [Pseudomonas sp. COR18]|uniref:hypothetical protein n=1 Tax=Pseudomonas sp. COR18 TaxID=3399680 RepID=UPI003B005D6E